MNWTRDGKDWPNHRYSFFHNSGFHHWHVQAKGQGPMVLLLHGAGASSHSWREVFCGLSRDHRMVAIDLPGQGFTRLGNKNRCGLTDMATDIGQLLDDLDIQPDVIVGHSAGASIAMRMTLDMPVKPSALVSINGALSDFDGTAGVVFPFLAKVLSINPFTAIGFARYAAFGDTVKRLVEATGSKIDQRGLDCYYRLICDTGHVDATLAMMAQWELRGLREELGNIRIPVLFLTGDRDRAVPPTTSQIAAGQIAGSVVEMLPDLGHLLHEEDPQVAIMRIRRFVREQL